MLIEGKLHVMAISFGLAILVKLEQKAANQSDAVIRPEPNLIKRLGYKT